MAAKRSSARRGTAAGKAKKKRSPAAAASSPAKRKPAGKAGAKKAARGAEPKAAETRGEAQVRQIQRVIDVMVAAGAVEVELEEAGSKLRVRLKEGQTVVAVAPPEARAVAPAPRLEVAAAEHVIAKDAGAAAEALPAGEPFKSPMVGTFYLAPSPDSEPFVKVGDMVTPDTVVCIIEAMKVMNEIKAEIEGQIVEVSAQNGEPVEYGQTLFLIRI